MTSQVEFFCSANEERALLQYLARSGTVFCDLEDGTVSKWLDHQEVEPPDWGSPWFQLAWVRAHGDLRWYGSHPRLRPKTHSSLVASLFAQREWSNRDLSDGDQLLDTDRSPVVYVKRLGKVDGRWAPSSILAPPGNLTAVGDEYARWVRRTLDWVRRRGRIVHDHRKPSERISNPHHILNTVYALADVQEAIESQPENFVIVSS